MVVRVTISQPVERPVVPLLLCVLMLVEEIFAVFSDSDKKAITGFVHTDFFDFARTIEVHLHIGIQG